MHPNVNKHPVAPPVTAKSSQQPQSILKQSTRLIQPSANVTSTGNAPNFFAQHHPQLQNLTDQHPQP